MSQTSQTSSLRTGDVNKKMLSICLSTLNFIFEDIFLVIFGNKTRLSDTKPLGVHTYFVSGGHRFGNF